MRPKCARSAAAAKDSFLDADVRRISLRAIGRLCRRLTYIALILRETTRLNAEFVEQYRILDKNIDIVSSV